MAAGQRLWNDYTTKGISIERIYFDLDFWENKLLPKLTSFYDNCLAPEILHPMVSQYAIYGNLETFKEHSYTICTKLCCVCLCIVLFLLFMHYQNHYLRRLMMCYRPQSLCQWGVAQVVRKSLSAKHRHTIWLVRRAILIPFRMVKFFIRPIHVYAVRR